MCLPSMADTHSSDRIDYGTVQGLPHSDAEWQIPVGLQLVPAALLGLGLIPQKESIRWLAKKGRNDEAWEALTWMRADSGPEVKAEFNEIKTGIAEELRATEGFKKRELLQPANRYRIALAFGIFLGQQCTGMTALAYFAPQFFKLLLGAGTKNLLVTGLFGAQKFITVGTYIFLFSERWGRKPTLWIAAILMSICFIIVTIVNKTTPAPIDNKTTAAGIATVAMIFLTNTIYQFSWGPLPWPYAAEVSSFPSHHHTHCANSQLDLSIPHPRIWHRSWRGHTMALQLPVLPDHTLHDRSMGHIRLRLLRHSRSGHGHPSLLLPERDERQDTRRDGSAVPLEGCV